MANREIRDYNTFSGDNDEGYLIVGGIEGVEGGKKLLSEIVGSNVPDYPTTAGPGDTERYYLNVYNNTSQGMIINWEELPVYDTISGGGLVLHSGQTSFDYGIDTDAANDGDVLTFDYSTDSVVWSDRLTLLEQRVAYLETLNGISNPTVNSFNPNVNGFSPTIKE